VSGAVNRTLTAVTVEGLDRSGTGSPGRVADRSI